MIDLSPLVITVDLGGTNLRVGAVREDGCVAERIKWDSEARAGSRLVLNRVLQAIQEIAVRLEGKKETVLGLALGFPGIVDPERGVVYQSPHFPDWKDLDLYSFFKKELHWPVVADNDANLAALGEGWKGAGKDLKNFVMVTLGTGIGGGIVIDKKIWHGDRGFAGEIGHVCIQTDGPRCACGSHGCLEMYASTQGILRIVDETDDVEGREKLLAQLGITRERLTVFHLHEAALDGDIFANVTFKKMGYYLGIGIASLVNTLGVETFVIGGGISIAWAFFIDAAKKELAERTYKENVKHIQIQKAELGDDAGLVGGAAAFFSLQGPGQF